MRIGSRGLSWFFALPAVPFLMGSLLCAEEPLPFPHMASKVGQIVRLNYYDPRRFHPTLMVERALRAMELSEELLELSWDKANLRLQYGAKVHTISFAEPKTSKEAFERIQRLIDLLDELKLPISQAMVSDEEIEVPRLDAKAARVRSLAYQALNGALQTLDPHTVLIPPAPASNFKETISGKFYGIGAYLRQDPSDGTVAIERVMPGCPAQKAGIKDGDVITLVDGDKTTGLLLPEVVKRIKGPKDTNVSLTVQRGPEKKPVDITVTRGEITIIALAAKRIGDIGYVRMDEFSQVTDNDLVKAITGLAQQGDGRPLSGFILDLRFNSGGLLNMAHKIGSLFLPGDKEVVRTVNLGGETRRFLSDPFQIFEGPMIVLTSGSSASASEIIAGSLQINDRAVVVGARTFGKGSVQTVEPLEDDSQLKFTFQEYQLAGGVSIQECSVLPDLQLTQATMLSDAKVDVLPYQPEYEADNEFHLPCHNPSPIQTTLRLQWLQQHWTEAQWEKTRIGVADFEPDQESQMVMALLAEAIADPKAQKNLEIAKKEGHQRQALLSALKGPVERRQAIELQRLSEAVSAAIQHPWGEATPISASAALRCETDIPKSFQAGQTHKLRFVVHNTGGATVGQLVGRVKGDEGSPLDQSEIVFGSVPAGGSVEGFLSYRIPRRHPGGQEQATLELIQFADGKTIWSLPFAVTIEPIPSPRLSAEWRILDTKKTPAGIVVDEPRLLEVTLQNVGEGSVEAGQISVFKDNDPFLQFSETRAAFGTLSPGATVAKIFAFTLRRDPPAGFSARVPSDILRMQFRCMENAEGPDGWMRAELFHAIELPRPTATNPGKPAKGTIRKPRVISSILSQSSTQAVLSLSVDDLKPRSLAVFLGKEKIALLTPASDGTLKEQQVFIPLQVGANSIRLLAANQDGVNASSIIRLWQ